MTKYREILRLTALGLSQRDIIHSIGVSQKTVVKVQKRAQEMHLSWPLDESLTDSALETLMFHKESKVSKQKRMPDFNYIQKELHRNGVNKKLLWTEYLEECRQSGDEPLMYSQSTNAPGIIPGSAFLFRTVFHTSSYDNFCRFAFLADLKLFK